MFLLFLSSYTAHKRRLEKTVMSTNYDEHYFSNYNIFQNIVSYFGIVGDAFVPIKWILKNVKRIAFFVVQLSE